MSHEDPRSDGGVRVGERLRVVRQRIERSGGGEAVRVVAVTKGFGPEAVRAALANGLADIGENYADELVEKARHFVDDAVAPRWHFLGAIQRNKIARLAPFVGSWQGVDRLEEGEAIARRCPGAAVLVEVATVDRADRPGVGLDAVEALVAALRARDLDVRGLMTVAPPVAEDRSATERAFAAVGAMVERLGLAEASMGMSDDLELAVANGATMVRVGRALFGTRPKPSEVAQ